MDREVRELEKQEKKLTIEIKAEAKKGNKQTATILAKQMVKLRQQKTRLLVGKTQMKGIGMNLTAMNAQVTVANSMKTAGKAMQSMNAAVDPVALQRTMAQFSAESEKFSMTQEMMDDTLDSMFDDEDEEETDGVVDQVFAELGLETMGQLSTVSAGTTALDATPAAEPAVSTAADDALMARLAALGS
jgi:division protein CdvB (Snf7/Vps24/ESCRT-III family)